MARTHSAERPGINSLSQPSLVSSDKAVKGMSTQITTTADILEETARQIIAEAVQKAVLAERARIVALDDEKRRAEAAHALSGAMLRAHAERYGS